MQANLKPLKPANPFTIKVFSYTHNKTRLILKRASLYHLVFMIWCGQEDLNLHRVAPTRT